MKKPPANLPKREMKPLPKVSILSPVPEGKVVELLLIQSHPTKEDLEKRAVGIAGYAADEIMAALEEAEIDPDKVHITLMCKHGIGSKSKPTTEDIDAWREALDAEIEAIKPKIIMPLGAEPFKRVMKANVGITDYVGEISDCPYGKMIANYSPGLVVADPTKRPEYRDVFRFAKKALDGKLDYDDYTWIVVDKPEDNIKILQKYIAKGDLRIGYDAEWFGSKWSDDEVMYDFQYSLEKDVAIILNISPDGVTENRELLDTMKLLLESPEAKRMGWNIRADDLRLRHRGFNLPDESLAFDGMKAVAFFDSRLGKGLETGIKLFTDYPRYYTALNKALKKHKLQKHEMSKLKFYEPEIYYRYCAGDAVAHREACIRMQEAFPQDMWPLYRDVFLPLTNYFTDMELTGIPIDKEVLTDITEKYSAMYELKRKTLCEYLQEAYGDKLLAHGIEEFNPNSSKQKKTLLFDILKLPPAYYTKNGKSPKSKSWYQNQVKNGSKILHMYSPSTNAKSCATICFDLEEALIKAPETGEPEQPIRDALKVVKLLLETSRVGVFATKFLSTRGIQVDPEADDDDDDEPLKGSYWTATCPDGRIHASYFECLKNFRASSSPNVQNPASKVLAHMPEIFVPGHSKMSKDEQKAVAHLIPANLRNIFATQSKDFVFCELDVAGADLAIMAFLSGDEQFIYDMRKGSFHVTKMRTYFNDDTLTKKDVSKYTISKGITFRVSYTAGLTFAAQPIQADIYAENGLYVDLETITYALKTWERYTQYMKYRDQCTDEVDNHQRITNARGCVLKYEKTDNFGILAGWKNEALAFPVASELAWFMWLASLNLKEFLKKEGLWMKYVLPTNTVHDAGYWLVHKDLLQGNYIQEVLKHVFCKQTKLVTGHNVGCEMVISECWKGKPAIWEGETAWNFDKNVWEWK